MEVRDVAMSPLGPRQIAAAAVEVSADTIPRTDPENPGTNYATAVVLLSQDGGASWTRRVLPYIPYYTTNVTVGYLSVAEPRTILFDTAGRIHVVGEAHAQYTNGGSSIRSFQPSVGFHLRSDNGGAEWTIAGRFGDGSVYPWSTDLVDLGSGRLVVFWTEEEQAFASASNDSGRSWKPVESPLALDCRSIDAATATSAGALAVCSGGSPHLIEYSLSSLTLEDRGYPTGGTSVDPECFPFGLAANGPRVYLFGEASCHPNLQLYSEDAGITWTPRTGYRLGIPTVSPRALDAVADGADRFHISYRAGDTVTHAVVSSDGMELVGQLELEIGECESPTTGFLGVRGFGFALQGAHGIAVWGCDGLAAASVSVVEDDGTG